MNTYSKYVPNVFLAKCTEKHQKGDVINVTTKYGKENESIIFNLVYERDGFYFYSIVRADGFNVQERAKAKAERYEKLADSAEKKSDSFYQQSHNATKHIPMGQPILVGHHSERRHRRYLDKSWNAMGKSVELSEKAKNHEYKSEYWAKRANDINLSMPESLEFYEFELEKAKAKHEGLKNGTIKKEHSYSLTYAKKHVNEIEAKLKVARQLWENNEKLFYINEGIDHLNKKPLFRVESTSVNSNEYVGEWHISKVDAEKELHEINQREEVLS